MQITTAKVLARKDFQERYLPLFLCLLAIKHRVSVVEVYTRHSAELYCWLAFTADTIAKAAKQAKVAKDYSEIYQHFADHAGKHSAESVLDCKAFFGRCLDESIKLRSSQTRLSVDEVSKQLLAGDNRTMSFVQRTIYRLAEQFAADLNTKNTQ